MAAEPESVSVTGDMAVLRRYLEDPEFEAHIGDLLDRVLDPESLTVETFLDLGVRFAEYLGDPEGSGSLELMDALNPARAMDEEVVIPLQEGGADPEDVQKFVGVIRRLRSLYGPAMKDTIQMSNEDPDDWMHVNVDPSYHHYAGKWKLKFEITKYDGSEITLTASPASTVNLLTFMLQSLNAIPDLGVEFVPSSSFARATEEFDTLRAWVESQESEEASTDDDE